MANLNEYKKAWDTYRALAIKSVNDLPPRTEKNAAHQIVIAMEREAAKNGIVLESGQQVGTMPTKRSMQEEYIRGFDNKAQVDLGDGPTTLQEHHAKRLHHK